MVGSSKRARQVASEENDIPRGKRTRTGENKEPPANILEEAAFMPSDIRRLQKYCSLSDDLKAKSEQARTYCETSLKSAKKTIEVVQDIKDYLDSLNYALDTLTDDINLSLERK